MKNLILMLVFLLSVSCVDQLTTKDGGSSDGKTSDSSNTKNPACDINSAPGQDLGFDGIGSVTQITQEKARVNWTKVGNEAASYTIFQLIDDKLKFHKVAAGTRNTVLLTKLTPNTEYKFLVRMMDREGVVDNNNKTISITTPPWPIYSNQKSVNLNGSRAIKLVDSRQLVPNDKRFTISAWFKTSTVQNSKRLFNLHQGSGAGSAINLGFSSSGIFAGYYPKLGSYKTIDHAVNYADGEWHHIAVTYSENNNSNLYRLYFDGVKVADRHDSFVGLGSFEARIGSYNGSSHYFTGTVDEVSVWRTPLKPARVARIYKDENGVVGSQDLKRHSNAGALVAWWRLGDGADSVTNFEDRVGNHDGEGTGLVAGDIVNDGP